jgi:cytochrome c-type biogenesis protein CcmH/NrfG
VTNSASTLYQQAGAEAVAAIDAYKQLVRLQPNDPNVQLELAQTAQQTGDVTTAIAAYQAFLKLSPDDPNASVVRAQLKQLRKNASG